MQLYNTQKNGVKLNATKYFELPARQIKPNGWLIEQLNIQKNGLTGNIEDIWPDVSKFSSWLQGCGENWERGPYYLDGLIPLAFLLEDEELLEKVEKWVWSIYSTQLDNGWFGVENNNDWWPRMVLIKCFQQYYEYTNDKRIVEFIKKYLFYMYEHIENRPFENWGRSRVGDNVFVTTWLYNLIQEDWLVELGKMILKLGFNWTKYFNNIPYTNPTRVYYNWELIHTKEFEQIDGLSTHTVNIAMGIKYPYFDYIYNGDKTKVEDLLKGINKLMEHHGQAYGIWSGDEHLNGTSPSSGAEFCSINEYMFSIEKILREESLSDLGDVVEKLMYNAFFAVNDYEMKTHQYDQQANQVIIKEGEKPFYNNGGDANIFGLEPHFGCCTANMHQGLPKFVQHLWYGQENGLYKAIYGPSILNTNINGSDVKIVESTNYPFSNNINYTIETSDNVEFLIDFRVPYWSKNRVTINGIIYDGDIVTYKVNTKECKEINLEFSNFEVISHNGNNDSKYYTYGPILLTLNIGEEWEISKYKNRGEYANFEVYPTTSWNYAIKQESITLIGCEENILFNKKGAPLKLKAKGRKIRWEMEKNSAAIPPKNLEFLLEEEDIELVAYGTSKLRLTCFPVYN